MITLRNARSATSEATRPIERRYVRTGHHYNIATVKFEAAIGRLDPAVPEALRMRQAPWDEVQTAMDQMAGPSGLMLFARYDEGSIASLAGKRIRCCLYIVGNPAIATKILRIDPAAGLYVPFRVAIYQMESETDATISFDEPASFLGGTDNPEMRQLAKYLEEKIDEVVRNVQRA